VRLTELARRLTILQAEPKKTPPEITVAFI